LLFILAATTGITSELGIHAPFKTPAFAPPNPPVVPRQGGDKIATARIIPNLPYSDTGTTTGYNDDYDEVCPYIGATAPDVVYEYVAASSVFVDIDLCLSSFDTKVYVYDDILHLIDCNDDFYFGGYCFVYSSRLEYVSFNAGDTYDIVVDGHGSASGSYVLDVTTSDDPCVLTCPVSGYPEGEPPLVPDYTDNWNGGCDAPGSPFQTISLHWSIAFCGQSGWYTCQGNQCRDTDWFILNIGPVGVLEITADAEWPIYVFELGPQDCANIGVVQQMTAGPCDETFMAIYGPPYTPVLLWIGLTVFAPPSGATLTYDYIVRFYYGIAATEPMTWSNVKALYR